MSILRGLVAEITPEWLRPKTGGEAAARRVPAEKATVASGQRSPDPAHASGEDEAQDKKAD